MIRKALSPLLARWRSRLSRLSRSAASRAPHAASNLLARLAPDRPASPDEETGGIALSLLKPDLPASETSNAESRQRLAGWSAHVRSRILAFPLPYTIGVLLLLLLLPAIALLRLPRPLAVGLDQLINETSLLQSFSPAPDRPVPDLWKERLGPKLAEALWRRQRGLWWQLWGEHAGAAPMLAFSANSLPLGRNGPPPANGLRVGDLIVVAPDALSLKQLRDRLLPDQRPSQGLNRRCLDQLRNDQAVLWNPGGMGVISGPLAPLLPRFSHGCLSLSVGAGQVIWKGQAADESGRRDPLDPARSPGPATLPPLPPAQLLEIQGGSVDLLLQDLITRPLIREPLINVYGLGGSRLALLHRTPFRLQLRPLAKGPFRAVLELQLPVGRERGQWEALLQQLSRSLVERGFTPVSEAEARASATLASPIPVMPADSNRPPSTRPNPSMARFPAGASWKRPDGVIAGGWRWLLRSGADPQLLFFLGPAPTEPLQPIIGGASALPAKGVMLLRSNPSGLQQAELLPAEVPELVRRADQLWMIATPAGASDSSLSYLTGGLRVPR